MTDVLTEEEALKLFKETSDAIRDADNVKLGELNKVQDPTENTEEVDTSGEQTPPDKLPDDDTNKDTPPDKAEDKVDDGDGDTNPPELSDLEKLNQQLELLKKENHSLKSQAGRVPHVQRRLQEMDRKLEALTKAQTSPSSQPSAKVTPKVTEMLKGIRDTDPDLADTIANVIAAASDEAAAHNTTREIENTRADREDLMKQYREEQTNVLLETFPNAVEVFQSPSFTKWVSEQSPTMQKLVNSDTAADVTHAFEKYADDMRRLHPELNKPAQATPVQAPDAEATERARQVEAERLRKKQTAANVNSPTAPSKVEVPDDPKALFEKFSKQIRDERNGK